jgi:hypothetical protein
MQDFTVLDQLDFTGVADPNFLRDFAFGSIVKLFLTLKA